jgi:two-component system response regulator PilR (NtrC family)
MDNTKDTVLIVDDEADIRDLLEMLLQQIDIPCITCGSVEEAEEALKDQRIGVCLTDLRLPDGDGLDIVRHTTLHYPDIPTAVFTAHGNVETAVEALKCGAFDFVAKPVDMDELVKLVTHGLSAAQSIATETHNRIDKLLGESDVMAHVRDLILKVSRSQAPVYISGPSGSGKELAARLIHECGPRSAGPFIAVNCGAIPGELMESELFGHKKGSFTGAITDTIGLFEAASGGTLFLDEIADLPLGIQVKLLRAVQEKKIRRVGETNETDIDVRILSATHTDLSRAVAEGRFRQDLFYRINVIQIDLPGLVERKGDIPTLARHFIEKIAPDEGIELTTDAIFGLQGHTFTGNVRELENIIERALALRESKSISVEDLGLANEASILGGSGEYTVGTEPLTHFLERTERDALAAAMAQANGNQTEAARLLGLSFRTMRYKVKKFGIK